MTDIAHLSADIHGEGKMRQLC